MKEQGLKILSFFNPWTYHYHVYRLDESGFKQIHCFGPLGKRDARRIIKEYREQEPN